VVLLTNIDEHGVPTSLGSGFVVATGKIVTNFHVIRGANSMTAKLADGSTHDVDGVLAYDRNRDFAILRVQGIHTKPLPLGDSSTVQTGDPVSAIGSPHGLQNSLSSGLVSGIRNETIQTTAAISHGSSGGPLLNSHGEVIGITTAMDPRNNAENLNFARPINWIKTSLENDTIQEFSLLRSDSAASIPIKGSLTVAAHQSRKVTLPVTETLADASLSGSFSSSGGIGGKIAVTILSNGHVVYQTHDSSGSLNVHLPQGTFEIIISNDALAFSRTVTLDLSLNYIR
jgi:S1-C subfamily serine protease